MQHLKRSRIVNFKHFSGWTTFVFCFFYPIHHVLDMSTLHYSQRVKQSPVWPHCEPGTVNIKHVSCSCSIAKSWVGCKSVWLVYCESLFPPVLVADQVSSQVLLENLSPYKVIWLVSTNCQGLVKRGLVQGLICPPLIMKRLSCGINTQAGLTGHTFRIWWDHVH